MNKRMILTTDARVNAAFGEFTFEKGKGYVMFPALPTPNNLHPEERLRIYDHRPATVEFIEKIIQLPKTTRVGPWRYKSSTEQAGPICCDARVSVEEKQQGLIYTPIINLYPLEAGAEPTAMLAVREYATNNQDSLYFTITENKALWTWTGNCFSRTRHSSKTTIVSLTNSYATLKIRCRWWRQSNEATDLFNDKLPWENEK